MRSEIELPTSIKRYGYDIGDLNYCHHCKQIKRNIVHTKCRYTSKSGSQSGQLFYPVAVHIDRVKVYNVDLNSENAQDTLILKKIVADKKRRRALEE